MDNFVIFVSDAAPGDFVSAKIVKIKKNYAEAKLEKIIKPSQDRIKPRCVHFGLCGGCSMQFLNYENQLKRKEKMVADALRQIGGFKDIKIEPIIGSESPWFYRNKMEYSFGSEQDEQSERDNQKRLALGLHPRKNYREIFDLEECFLQSPASVEITKAVAQWAREKKLTAYDTKTKDMLFRNLIVREGKNTGELMINLVVNGKDFALENEFAKWIMAKFPTITSLYRTSITTKRGFKTAIEEFHIAGKPTLTETLKIEKSERSEQKLKLKFEILPQAFFQPNTKQAEILYGKIFAFAQTDNNDSILDLYCGTGTISMFFAKTGCRATGIDINKSAIENAKNNAALNNLSNIEFLCGDIDKFLNSLQRPSILITDPPRPGIAPKSLMKILALKIPKWIYVSCNPTTLARDLKIIYANNYQIKKIQPVDMFPQTYHVETVCLLNTHSFA